MLDCTTEKYDDLYDRWLDKPGELLDWAKYDPKKHRLLDLCGGTGAVSKAACARGAKSVWLYDLNPRVTDARVHPLKGRAEDIDLSRGSWNLAVCRQALGYLDIYRVARSLRFVIEPGGRFVFNTFVRPKWGFKTYRRTASDWTRRYYEASAYLGRRVVHLQGRVGGGFDVTAFRWWTEKDILDAFSRGWAVADFKVTASTLWFSFECLSRGL